MSPSKGPVSILSSFGMSAAMVCKNACGRSRTTRAMAPFPWSRQASSMSVRKASPNLCRGPQDVMRILVHVQAYGDAAKVPELVARHSGSICVNTTK